MVETTTAITTCAGCGAPSPMGDPRLPERRVRPPLPGLRQCHGDARPGRRASVDRLPGHPDAADPRRRILSPRRASGRSPVARPDQTPEGRGGVTAGVLRGRRSFGAATTTDPDAAWRRSTEPAARRQRRNRGSAGPAPRSLGSRRAVAGVYGLAAIRVQTSWTLSPRRLSSARSHLAKIPPRVLPEALESSPESGARRGPPGEPPVPPRRARSDDRALRARRRSPPIPPQPLRRPAAGRAGAGRQVAPVAAGTPGSGHAGDALTPGHAHREVGPGHSAR